MLEANIKWELGDVESYTALISKALEIDPLNADLLYNLGVVSSDRGDLESAKMYYNKAISVDPNYTRAYLNMVTIIFKELKIVEQKMNKLGNSTADYNKYDAFKVDLNDLYTIAIPYLNYVLKIEPEN